MSSIRVHVTALLRVPSRSATHITRNLSLVLPTYVREYHGNKPVWRMHGMDSKDDPCWMKCQWLMQDEGRKAAPGWRDDRRQVMLYELICSVKKIHLIGRHAVIVRSSKSSRAATPRWNEEGYARRMRPRSRGHGKFPTCHLPSAICCASLLNFLLRLLPIPPSAPTIPRSTLVVAVCDLVNVITRPSRRCFIACRLTALAAHYPV